MQREQTQSDSVMSVWRSEPRGNRLFADVEKFVDLERALFNERSDSDFNLTTVLLRCHNNRSIYEVIQSHTFSVNDQPPIVFIVIH